MLFLYIWTYDIWKNLNDLPQIIVFLIGSICVFFHFYYALSRQLVIKNKTGGHEKQNNNLCKPIFSTKTRGHKRFDWLIIRYFLQDAGLKYLHLSIDYETNIQILIDVCERHMAKETKGIKRKYLLKVSIDEELVNQNQLLSTKGNNN